ncbi:MAG TPA: fluoride efflux transporter CrcB [Solirubrobacteraceae bacterium]|jgi:CrcB protein
MSAWVWVGVAVLGSLGALARMGLETRISSRRRMAFPLGTFAVNISGAFAAGLLAGLTVAGNAQVLLGAGAIGSYTTFSTWMLETHRLNEDGDRQAALVNVLASVACGLAAAAFGRTVGGWL